MTDIVDARTGDPLDPDKCLAPPLTTTDGVPVDHRPRAARLADHERLRSNGSLLATRLGADQHLPPFQARAYEGDCGYDLAIIEEAVIRPGETHNLRTGVAIALPPYTFGFIYGRSSTWTKWGLQVMGSIIDEGWRGELNVLTFRPVRFPEPNDHELIVPAGTRLGQLIILPNLADQVQLYRVLPDDLPGSDRGTNGFGSTG